MCFGMMRLVLAGNGVWFAINVNSAREAVVAAGWPLLNRSEAERAEAGR